MTLPEPVRRRPISKKIQMACDLLAAGKNQTEAAEQAGIARETLSRALNKQWVLNFLQKRAGRSIAVAVGKAAATKVALLNSESDHCRDSASSFVLGVAGIKPVADSNVSLQVGLEVRAGYVLDLRGRSADVVDAKGNGDVIDLIPNAKQLEGKP